MEPELDGRADRGLRYQRSDDRGRRRPVLRELDGDRHLRRLPGQRAHVERGFYLKGSGSGVHTTGNTTIDNGLAGSPNEYGTSPLFDNQANYNYHFFINLAGGTTQAGVRVLNTAGTNWIVPAAAPNYSVSLSGTLGQPAAYVCRGPLCTPPITDPAELATRLASASPAPRARS